jgi:hypothetical protein
VKPTPGARTALLGFLVDTIRASMAKRDTVNAILPRLRPPLIQHFVSGRMGSVGRIATQKSRQCSCCSSRVTGFSDKLLGFG